MPDLRKDPIVGRWVIIAHERAKRPHDFKGDAQLQPEGGLCPFCEGQEDKTPPEIIAYRERGARPNKPGWRIRVVPNKFPALMIEGGLNRQAEGMFDRMNGVGAHEVIVETPDHNSTLAMLTEKRIEDVLWAWRDRILDLKQDKRFKYILIFKNHGEAAGASLDHTHCQLIALPIVPRTMRDEVAGARAHFDLKDRCVFCDIVRQEQDSRTRRATNTTASRGCSRKRSSA